MNIQVTLAMRYLWGRKLRTALTTLAIVFGVLVIFVMNTLLPTMLNAFTSNIRAASGQVDLSISLKSGESFAPAVVNKISAVEGVSAVAGSLTRVLNLPQNWFGSDVSLTTLTLVGIDPREAQTVRNYTVVEGRFLRSSDELSAVVTQSLADQLGLQLGDDLTVPTTAGTVSLTLVGITPARAVPGNEEVLITLYEAQKLLDLPKRINTIEANFSTTDTAQREAIQTAIQQQLGDAYQFGSLAGGSEIITSLQTAQMAFNVFGFLSLFMGGFIIFNTFRTIIAERRRDIGMLRTLGASRSTIVGLILTEGLIQGGLGTAIGMGLGYLAAVGVIAGTAGVFSQIVHIELGMPVVTPALIAITIFLGVGVTLVSGMLPAISASRLTPMAALRASAAETGNATLNGWTWTGLVLIALAIGGLLSGNIGLTAVGGLFFLLGLVLIAPILVKPIAIVFGAMVGLFFARQGTGTLAQGNLTRQPSRAAVTASATMIGLSVIVAVGGLTASMTVGFMEVMRHSLGSDYLFVPPSVGLWSSDVGANSELANSLRAVRGMGPVSTMRFAASDIGGESVTMLGIDPEIFPQVSPLSFDAGDPATAYKQINSGRALIANGRLAAQLGLHLGDLVELTTPEGVYQYYVAGIGGDYFNAKLVTAYISQDTMRADFHKTEDIFIQMNLAPGADVTAVEADLKEIAAQYPQFSLVSGRDYFDQNRQLLDAGFMAYYVIFIVLALPSLIAILNTLAIGVIERTREIGMLRAIGSTQGQVRQMIVAEALLLAATGTAFGLLAGLYLGYILVNALTSTGFPVQYSFPFGGMLAAIAVGLIFGVVAAIIPARQAAKMEIVKALRYE